MIGINPATDSPAATADLLHLLDEIRQRFDIPTQSCVLSHVTTTMELIETGRAGGSGVPVDRRHRGANSGFGVDICAAARGQQAGRGAGPRHRRRQRDVPRDRAGVGAVGGRTPRHRWTAGGPADAGDPGLRGGAAAGPLLVNTVVGFIGPEYLYDGKQIVRAGLEDHFCGKLLGLPMGVDVCYTNHAEADQDDMDTLLTLLGAAGVGFVIAVPGADDIMLGYQSLSFHDVLYVRQVLGLRPAPEFETWLQGLGMADGAGRVLPIDAAGLAAAPTDERRMTAEPDDGDGTPVVTRLLGRAADDHPVPDRPGPGGRFAAHPPGAGVQRGTRAGPRRRPRAVGRRAFAEAGSPGWVSATR